MGRGFVTACINHQVRRKGANVAGDVDVFRFPRPGHVPIRLCRVREVVLAHKHVGWKVPFDR